MKAAMVLLLVALAILPAIAVIRARIERGRPPPPPPGPPPPADSL